jgi:hypothetical protein
MTLYAVPTHLMQYILENAFDYHYCIARGATRTARVACAGVFTEFRRFAMSTMCSNETCEVYSSAGGGRMGVVDRSNIHPTDLRPPLVLMRTTREYSYAILEDAFPYGDGENERILPSE